jgi:hypothetical protein
MPRRACLLGLATPRTRRKGGPLSADSVVKFESGESNPRDKTMQAIADALTSADLPASRQNPSPPTNPRLSRQKLDRTGSVRN